MASKCCETFKSLLDSIFGGAQEVKEADIANDVHAPNPPDLDEPVITIQAAEIAPANYQFIVDQASSDFLASKVKAKGEQQSSLALTQEQIEQLRIKLQQAVVSSSFVPLVLPTNEVAESQANKGQTSKKKRSKNRKSPDNQLLNQGVVNQEDGMDTTGKLWEVDSSNLLETIQGIDPIAHFTSSDVR